MGSSSHQWSALAPVCQKINKRAKFDSLFFFPVPTRLFALKHGATLVWGPEIVDKAILHSTREVDRTHEKLSLTLTYTNEI